MRRLVVLPLLLAAAFGTAVLLQGRAGAADDDPLGYVVDREALDDPEVIQRGQELFAVRCVSCHDQDGSGIEGLGPDVRGQGAAGGHYWLTSGRMPAEEGLPAQSERKESPFTDEEIEALVAYVASLGEGPEIPTVDPDAGDLARGGEIFRLNCAACHQAALAGGALSYGRNAPTLEPVTAVQIAEALELGPGQMPVFDYFTEEEVDSLIAYVRDLQEDDSPGGFSLGRIGPIPEGFVAIVGGMGLLVLLTVWIGKRRLQEDDDDDPRQRPVAASQ
ncbi:MAG: menaquinol--cytochrome c reductase [Acidimicrobiales bacterium]|nr:menaquinol--cytochrome c reductase [Acidimicrobiales bacterium]